MVKDILSPLLMTTHDICISFLLYDKCEALHAFKIYKAEIEKQLGKQIKIVKSDRGGEYYGRYTKKGQLSNPFVRFLQEHGIVVQYTMSGLPFQNGVAEI